MRTIDADALKKAMDELFKNGGYDSGLVINTIDNAPTVDTTFREVVAYECGQKSVEERPKGSWITRTYDEGITYHFYCSECEREVQIITNFCPNCGAKIKYESDV